VSFASAFGADAAVGEAGLAAAVTAAAAEGTATWRAAGGAGAGGAEAREGVEAGEGEGAEEHYYAFSQFAKQNVTAPELPGGPLVPWGTCHQCHEADIDVMGLSVRSDRWRYTEWFHCAPLPARGPA